MANVLIAAARGAMPAYVAGSTSVALAPRVVVLHYVDGRSQDIRNQADWLPAAGLLALAPGLYQHGGRRSCIAASCATSLRAMAPLSMTSNPDAPV